MAHSPPQLRASQASGDPFLILQRLSVCRAICPGSLGSRHKVASQNLSSSRGVEARGVGMDGWVYLEGLSDVAA